MKAQGVRKYLSLDKRCAPFHNFRRRLHEFLAGLLTRWPAYIGGKDCALFNLHDNTAFYIRQHLAKQLEPVSQGQLRRSDMRLFESFFSRHRNYQAGAEGKPQ